MGFVMLFALSMTGWSADPHATELDELRSDLGFLVTAVLAGTGAAAVFAWGLTDRAFLLLAVAVLGLVPTAVRVTAYFTGAF